MSNNTLETLTVNEVRIAERKSGVSFSALGDKNAKGQFDILQALVWVIGKRGNSAYTFEEAGDMTLVDMTEFLGLDAEEESDDEDGDAITAALEDIE